MVYVYAGPKEAYEKVEKFLKAYYMDDIVEIAEKYPKKRRLIIDYVDLAKYDYTLADTFLEQPEEMINVFQESLRRIEIPGLTKDVSFRVGLKNIPPIRKLLIREITSEFIGKVIAVEGIVREVTDIIPKIREAAWICKNCANIINIVQDGPVLKKPPVCTVCGKKDFELLEERSKFTDFQRINIQEPLEYLKGSEQSRNIHIYLEDDLVNLVSPGDRLLIVGILRIKRSQNKSTLQDKYIEALYIEHVDKEFEELEPTKEELRKIKELAKDPDIYQKLINSIAPSIKGHEKVKEAIALQLFGGVPKEEKGIRRRGNIHILLLGDPGTGKSQLLEYATKLAPKSFYVAGKTVTGAGLTASAEKDEDGRWVIKAGVLVLASGGLAAIDEFDKIDARERQSLHEAMEQQRVSVAKAGVVTRFKAETSVLAAANPKYGRFDSNKSIIEQINIDTAILNRFDLIFLIREVRSKEQDEEIAEHILKSHRAGQMKAQYEKSEYTSLTKEEVEEELKIIEPAIDPELLKKYIAYARTNVFPVFTKDAIEYLKNFYVEIRESGRKKNTIPISARQLEAMIRLAEASARVRLSDKITLEDAKRAQELLLYSLREVLTDPETGEIDVDQIYTGGIPRSKMQKLMAVLNIIKSYTETEKNISFRKLLEEVSELGIKKEELEEILHELKRRGEIIEVKTNHYAYVSTY